MHKVVWGCLSLCLLACTKAPTDSVDDTASEPVDADGDGFDADADCDDNNAAVHPEADEFCNGEDDDCDGEVDEDAVDAALWYTDADGDGYGDLDSVQTSCETIEGAVSNAEDCDDGNDAVNPEGVEICDGLDNDCDVSTSEDWMVTWTDSNGVASDVTGDFTGSSNAPLLYSVGEGELNFCDGTYYVNLEIEGGSELKSQSGDPTKAILDGVHTGPVVSLQGVDLSVKIEGLTLQNGNGADIDFLGEKYGGGISCFAFDGGSFGSSSVETDNVLIADSWAIGGAGFFSVFCDTVLKRTEIYDNLSNVAGGFMFLEGTHRFSDVRIHSNGAAIVGGGYIAGGIFGEDKSDATFVDVVVTENHGDELGGFAFANGSLSWSGTAGPENSGVFANTATDVYGGMSIANAEFQADTVDFGEGSSNNDIVDLSSEDAGVRFDYWAGTDASFECDKDGCGEPESFELGGNSTGGSADAKALMGNVVLADSDDTLNGWLQNFSNTSQPNCKVNFYLMRSLSQPKRSTEVDWEIVWRGDVESVSKTSDTHSGHVGLALEIGEYYALATLSSCSLGLYVDYQNAGVDAGFGKGVGIVRRFNTEVSDMEKDQITLDYFLDTYGSMLETEVVVTDL